ncbi:hypothetical protein DFJ73DRAFT_929749 [Zopfochytrium polystomum]|nr:hypothetical protein DFJ73DRAFT_929749 [Zopfochytrium polystomum]
MRKITINALKKEASLTVDLIPIKWRKKPPINYPLAIDSFRLRFRLTQSLSLAPLDEAKAVMELGECVVVSVPDRFAKHPCNRTFGSFHFAFDDCTLRRGRKRRFGSRPTVRRNADLKCIAPRAMRQVGRSLRSSKPEVAVLDVRRKNDWTDTIVVVTARSTKQLFSLVDAVRRKVRKYELPPSLVLFSHPSPAPKKFVHTDPTLRSSLTIEGASSTDWMVLDLGRFVVHSFTAAARAHYDIEGLWNSIDESPLATSAVSGDDGADALPTAEELLMTDEEYVEWREREETRRMLAAVEREWAGRSRATVKTKQLEEGDFMSEWEMIARLNAGAVRRAERRREGDLGI